MQRLNWRVLALALLALLLTACMSKPEGDEIGVQRGAGSFEGSTVKDVLCPGDGTKTVWNDDVHYYPHSGVRRYYDVFVKAQTSDGFFVTIRGQLQFNTNFSCDTERQRQLVQDFDSKFGVRRFAELGGKDQDGYHPYDGDRGWGAFLDTVGRPIFVNEIVRTIQGFTCRKMIASCALVASDSGGQQNVGTAKVDYTAIQSTVAEGMADQMERTLGDEYLTNWSFTMAAPQLEKGVHDAIVRAQASYANVSVQNAARDAANAQAEAAERLASVYAKVPALAELEALRIVCGTNAAVAQTQQGAKETGCNGAQIFLGVSPAVVGRR